jgi:hypothetical protein
MPHILPATAPIAYATRPGSAAIADVDTGGYDFTIGGHGFRFASDTQHPYQRFSEPTTVHRFDSSLEPGEQTLSDLPWIKSQASFHAGAGQLNLEQGFTSFQFQQEQVEHIRFDKSLGVDVWTPGQVSRLPDVKVFNISTTSGSCMISGSSGTTDYAIVGGNGVLMQLAWTSGPDVDPVQTNITPDVSTFGTSTNWNITDLATDGINYFGVIQMTADGFVSNMRTYVIRGQITSTDSPIAIYEVPGASTMATRTNLCTNPGFETNLTAWTAVGGNPPTLTRDTSRFRDGVASMRVAFNTAHAFTDNASYVISGLTVGGTYTCSAYIYMVTGSLTGNVSCGISGLSFGSTCTTFDAWTRISVTFTASATSHTFFAYSNTYTAGQFFNVDDVLIEASSTLGTFFSGDTPSTPSLTYAWTGTANASTSTAIGLTVAKQVPGIVGWNKARLMAGLGGSMYQLDSNALPHAALPAAKYTHPSTAWSWSALSESPTEILAAGTAGAESSILSFKLDTSGGAPTLTGGDVVAMLPPGERIQVMGSYLASFLAVGTSTGLRIGTYSSGSLALGPRSLETTQPVLAVLGRDRFFYGSYSDQQEDGTTGLARVDLTMVVDTSGRNAWAADLRPPTTAATGHGSVYAMALLPTSNRIVWLSTDGLHTEGGTAGSDGSAYLTTSRIRFDTAEPKLWVSGRLHGTIDQASIVVVGKTPFGLDDANLGTFGFIATNDDSLVEFGMPDGLHEWVQLQFQLVGSTAILNTYQAKALPSPTRQDIIQVSANCYSDESDRYGLDVTDPETPRDRWQNVADLESAGDAVRYVEFTNSGSVASIVYIDQSQFTSTFRPNIDDDFGGIISLKLRIISGGS